MCPKKFLKKRDYCSIPATHLAHILAWFCEASVKKIATVYYWQLFILFLNPISPMSEKNRTMEKCGALEWFANLGLLYALPPPPPPPPASVLPIEDKNDFNFHLVEHIWSYE